MPRRSAGGRPMSSVPMRRPVQQTMPAPAPAQTKQPGLMANMASTAAGVAIGSTVGHALGGMLMGGGGNQTPAEVAAPLASTTQDYNNSGMQERCHYEIMRFKECALTHKDVNLCQSLQHAMNSCLRSTNEYL